jgi:tRNA-splicing ligase RtcB
MTRHPLSRINRLDSSRANIENEYGVPITLYANKDVQIEAEGIEQLLEVAAIQETLDFIQSERPSFWGEGDPGKIESIVLTPDFHRGGGIPVGTVIDARRFVIPSAVGNDVCCGMRLLVTDLKADDIAQNMPAIKKRLREIFFQGKRDIPMSPRQREALLRDGLSGLHDTCGDNQQEGMWKHYDPRPQIDDLAKAHFEGALPAKEIFGFGKFIEASGKNDSRDGQIGSVGGGNHFVEVQQVEELFDGAIAHLWGVSKGCVAIMVHTGSVGLGNMVGGHFNGVAYDLYPRGIPHPEHGFYFLPTRGPHAKHARQYLDAMRNAANFAFANRLFLGLMATRAIGEAINKSVSSKLVYDAPHNLIWEDGERFLHRKGATPAIGMGNEGPFAYTGHPVIVPGSMGAASYLLAGTGNEGALCSACHGAGRAMTRGKSTHVDEHVYQEAVESLHVVTPIDPASPAVRGRRDILAKYHDRMKEEAPYAYKPITPVIESIEQGNVAKRVARLKPLVTVKG